VLVPRPGENVADGAARQAAWALAGGTAPPEWQHAETARYDAELVPAIRERYADVREMTASSGTRSCARH